MLWDKGTWSRNSRNHSVVFLLSSETRLIQSLHHITSHAYIYIHMHCVWFLAGLGYFLLCPQDEVPRFQWTKCRKFFPEVTFKDLSNQGICLFHQIINFYFLPSKIRFGFLSISIRSTSSSRQAVLDLVSPTLLTVYKRFFRHPIHLFDQIQPPSDPIGRQTVILFQQPHVYQIGRASCRERVCT